MDWILNINGHKEVVSFESGYQKALEKIKEYFVIKDDKAIPSFLNAYINKGNEIDPLLIPNELKDIFDYLYRQNNEDNLQTELFNRDGDTVEDEIMVFSHNIKETFELYFSIKESYIHTNFFNKNESYIFYFDILDVHTSRLGFFSPFLMNTSISFMSLEYAFYLQRLISSRGLFRQRLQNSVLMMNEFHNVINVLPRFFISISLILCTSKSKNRIIRRHIAIDNKKVLLIKTLLLRKDSVNTSPNTKVELCYDIGHCYLKLKKDKDAVIYFKEGANKEVGNNKCAYELGLLRDKKRFYKLKDKNGKRLLDKDKKDYLLLGGSSGAIELGNMYLSYGDYKSAIEEGYSKTEENSCTKGFAYLLAGDFDTAYNIFYTFRSPQKQLSSLENAALCVGVVMLNAMGYYDQNHHNVFDFVFSRPIRLPNNCNMWKNLFFYELDTRRGEDPCLDYLLSLFHMRGYGTRKSPEEAFRILNEWYLRHTDNCLILEQLRELYQLGIGTEINLEEANRISDRISELEYYEDLLVEDIEDDG